MLWHFLFCIIVWPFVQMRIYSKSFFIKKIYQYISEKFLCWFTEFVLLFPVGSFSIHIKIDNHNENKEIRNIIEYMTLFWKRGN